MAKIVTSPGRHRMKHGARLLAVAASGVLYASVTLPMACEAAPRWKPAAVSQLAAANAALSPSAIILIADTLPPQHSDEPSQPGTADIGDAFETFGRAVANGAKDAGHKIEGGAKDAGQKVATGARTFSHAVVDGWEAFKRSLNGEQ